jgi:hypothetical protein
VAAEVSLATLCEDARRRAPNPPRLADLIEDAGRQRLATYYLYSAVLAGIVSGPDQAAARWPAKLAEPMQRLGLTRWAPRTWKGLNAQLIPAEQHSLQSDDRQSEFAQLLLGLINGGAFGPLCGAADSVRLARQGPGRGQDLELMRDGRVVGTCKVVDHWELVAQHMAGAPLLSADPEADTTLTAEHSVEKQLKETGISHAVSLGTTLAVNVHPLGAAVGLGTRLVRARIQTGRDEAGTLRTLGQDIGTLCAEAKRDLADLDEQRNGAPTVLR